MAEPLLSGRLPKAKTETDPAFESYSQPVNQSVIKQYQEVGGGSRKNFNQVADCLFIPSYHWQSFILGQNTATHISHRGSKSKEGSLQREYFTSIRLYTCMTYNYHGRLLSLSFGVVLTDILCGQENLIYLLLMWKYGLLKSVYTFVMYCYGVNMDFISMSFMFNSKNEKLVVNGRASSLFIFSEFFPAVEEFRKWKKEKK